jgi:superfamily I DNA/RNA helicase
MSRLVKPDEWAPTNEINLEKTAREVVMSGANIGVIAGPGSGKTELLAQRALYLLQTGLCPAPQRILAISFKRDAAKNIRNRVEERCPRDMARRFDSFTFDGFSKSLVDRFLSLAPAWAQPPRGYGIYFPGRYDWQNFVDGLTPPEALGGMYAAQALGLNRVEQIPLPDSPDGPTDMATWLAIRWWKYRLTSGQPKLTFPMISTLAYSILLKNPQLVTALRLTYSHVFLDEFQDTTQQQYRQIKLIFQESDAVLTAVGDTKQRIMTWAGADPTIFASFREDFGAKVLQLQMNHRSNARVVQIINDLVHAIEPEAVDTISARPDDVVPDNAAAFMVFSNNKREQEWIADFVARALKMDAAEGRKPEDFAILVRTRANQIEERLVPEFEARGLRLRNEARLVGALSIQDVMTDDLCVLVEGLMRLTFSVRTHEIYPTVQELIGATMATDYTNPGDVRRLDDRIRELIELVVQETGLPPSEANIHSLVERVVNTIGKRAIQNTFRQYEDGSFFEGVVKSLIELIEENARVSANWPEVIDGFEGLGQVRLMTIHKSKGLEYHTVIFLGLHQNEFFGYRKDPQGETNTFFVALSRAKERIYFTRSEESGNVGEIQALVDLLDRANVPTVFVEAPDELPPLEF